jgi:phosphatidylglycerophosphatase A
LALVLATWFGAGFAPRAPGTAGTLATLPLLWALSLAPGWATPAATALVCVVGVWAAQRVAEARSEEDPQIVVIDEAAGVMLAFCVGAPAQLWSAAAAVVLFRLLDMTKPWPIAPLERLRPAGLGIMADDIAAGAIAGLIVRLI